MIGMGYQPPIQTDWDILTSNTLDYVLALHPLCAFMSKTLSVTLFNTFSESEPLLGAIKLPFKYRLRVKVEPKLFLTLIQRLIKHNSFAVSKTNLKVDV